MRFPWYIYAPLSLLVTFLTLYLCVKDHDIVTPPTPQETAESLRIWREDNPTIRNTKLTDIPPATPKSQPKPKPATPKTTPKPTPEPKPKPKSKPIVKIPETSPALNSLVRLNLTTQQLTAYAENMLKNNKPQLARIAYERIIDCAKDATANNRKSAATAIAKLLDKTPLWTPDPSARKKLTLNLTLNSTFSKESADTITQLETLIFDSSDGTLEPNIKLTSSTAPLSSLNLGEGTLLVTFNIKNSSELNPKILSALYYSIRNKNNQSQKLTSIPEIPTHIPPKQALQTYITRLAWINAAQ
ncbi:MAG: hypothetical protein ACSHX6_08560 [Akkermansiaceae bacterium]